MPVHKILQRSYSHDIEVMLGKHLLLNVAWTTFQ